MSKPDFHGYVPSNIRQMKTPDGKWRTWDDDEDPTPEHAWESPRYRAVGIGDTKQESMDDFCDEAGLPYSIKVTG